MLTVLSVLGTRPEAIKMAPVLWEFAKYPDRVRSLLCVTAQHRQMLDQVLELFQLVPDFDLDVMEEGQSLTTLTARILPKIEPILLTAMPDWVLVQGDTTTVMAVSLCAYYCKIRVAHIEAGLRTADKYAPFPEEINRRITTTIADFHFAPTETARQALLQENIADAQIRVTGNTVIDALLHVSARVRENPPPLPLGLQERLRGKRMILVTGHRRESFGDGFEQICLALREIANTHKEVVIVYPVHLNPNVREPVFRILADTARVHLIEPQPYASFVWLMNHADLILTDSGGVQEEAPSLGKPVLVMRQVTERSEGIAAGSAVLVGADCSTIVKETHDLLTNRERYERMARAHNPYGDGDAAPRIVRALLNAETAAEKIDSAAR